MTKKSNPQVTKPATFLRMNAMNNYLTARCSIDGLAIVEEMTSGERRVVYGPMGGAVIRFRIL